MMKIFFKDVNEGPVGWIGVSLIILIISFILIIPFSIMYSSQIKNQRIIECEKLGAVLLERTKGSGKSTSYEYICVDKSLIKNYPLTTE